MNTKLVKHGDELALVIDKKVLEIFQITIDTPIDMTTNQDGIQIRPVHDHLEWEHFEEALRSVTQEYASDLKKLAE